MGNNIKSLNIFNTLGYLPNSSSASLRSAPSPREKVCALRALSAQNNHLPYSLRKNFLFSRIPTEYFPLS